MTIEVGLFIDRRARNTFMEFYNNDMEKVKTFANHNARDHHR